jgi:hypothetical protein
MSHDWAPKNRSPLRKKTNMRADWFRLLDKSANRCDNLSAGMSQSSMQHQVKRQETCLEIAWTKLGRGPDSPVSNYCGAEASIEAVRRSPVMGWSGRAPAPPASELCQGAKVNDVSSVIVYRRQPRGEGEGDDANSVGGYEQVATNIKSLRSLDSLEGERDILGSADFQCDSV